MSVCKKDYLNVISQKIDYLSTDQLFVLFHVYLYLDCLCDFFMSEESHINLINIYYSNPCIRQHETLKTFMLLTVTTYTRISRFPDVLKAIEMIQEEYPFEIIVNTLYRQHNENNNLSL